MSAKIILFSAIGFRGSVAIFTTNDDNLVLNNRDFVFNSAIVVNGNWELFSEPARAGDMIDLRFDGGADADGTYEDYAAWGGDTAFNVQSIYHDGN